MGCFKHIATFIAAAALFLGVPTAAFANLDSIDAMLAGVDVVSSATTIQDAPSGRYTILVNRSEHADADALDDWVTFFSGKDAPLIMEDIDCMAIRGDVAGIEMAQSLQSRLPENQMDLEVVDGTLALSKGDAGMFDAIVMSEEVAQALSAETVEASQDVEVIRREG